jgi:hypothetical protein
MSNFVPAFYRLSIEGIDQMMYSWPDNHKVKWFELMAIDYAYHCTDKGYDGGISFIDRLYSKLHIFHPEWNLEDLKNKSRTTDTYHLTISEMLANQSDIDYYGV